MKKKNTDTPRTDAAAVDSIGQPHHLVSADFARGLEREISDERNRWKPTAKAYPEPGSTVLAFWTPVGGPFHAGCFAVATCANATHWHNPEDDEDDYAVPSHWMPLPEAPK